MIGVGLIVFAVLMLAVHLASVALVAWRLGRPAPRGLIPNEPVTLIRPIRGLTALERETLASSQTIACFFARRSRMTPR